MNECNYPRNKWIYRNGPAADPKDLAELGLPSPLVRLLVKRGISTISEAQAFLKPDLDNLQDPFGIPQMNTAVERILQALEGGEQIAVYGDYDADGVTATVLMQTALEGLGGNVSHFLPNRVLDGYGLQLDAINGLFRSGCKLLITVDTGITHNTEIAAAADLGMDVIVTDHHELASELPSSAIALLNPKIEGWPETLYGLAGVGVAFKLIQALHIALNIDPSVTLNYLDLVAIGTIADVAPLTNENRILVKHGLEVLSKTSRVGLSELMKVAGVDPSQLDAYHVGFMLAPRINAAGRLSDPSLAADLLLSESQSTAERLAKLLDKENRERQSQEAEILDQALSMIEETSKEDDRPAYVLSSDKWHPGIIGIVASRLVDRFHKPVVVIAVDGDTGKGSGRSIPGIHLAQALHDCCGLLEKYGGHEGAAGLTILSGNIDGFREQFTEWVRVKMSDTVPTRVIEIDDELAPDEIDINLARQLEVLAPFGSGNPKPVFSVRSLLPISHGYVGANKKHLKLRLKTRGLEVDAMGFNMPSDMVSVSDSGTPLDVVFNLDINSWNGRESLRLTLKDIRDSAVSSGSSVLSSGIDRLFGRLNLNDRRKASDKKDGLKFILETGEPAVVYIRGRHLVKGLAAALEIEWPHKKGRIAYYSEGMPSAGLSRALAAGNVDILIISDPLPQGVCFVGLRHVILYHICGSYEELRSILAIASGTSKVTLHLLFGEKDVLKNMETAQGSRLSFVVDMGRLREDELMQRLWTVGDAAGR